MANLFDPAGGIAMNHNRMMRKMLLAILGLGITALIGSGVYARSLAKKSEDTKPEAATSTLQAERIVAMTKPDSRPFHHWGFRIRRHRKRIMRQCRCQKMREKTW